MGSLRRRGGCRGGHPGCLQRRQRGDRRRLETPGSTAKANGPVQVALILKDFTNPYFISMENSAKADAAKSA